MGRQLDPTSGACGEISHAEQRLRESLSSKPTSLRVVIDLGHLLTVSRRALEAVELFRVAKLPGRKDTDFLLGYAEACLAAQVPHEALQIVRRVVRMFDCPELRTRILLARACRDTGKLCQAITVADEILRLEPASFEALYSKFSAQQTLGDLEGALSTAEKLLATPKGRDTRIISRYLHLLLFSTLSPVSISTAHESWANLNATPSQSPSPVRNPRRARRVRIGFVSHQFGRRWPEIQPVLQWLDRQRFEAHCYSDPKPASPQRERQLAGLADSWTEINGMSDAAAARLIREHEIDILVHFDSHMHGERFEMFAEKTAPIRVALSIYPSSTGSRAFDFLITDKYLAPPGKCEHLYSEKLIYVPLFACRLPARDAPPVSNPPVQRHGQFTFGSFSWPLKINHSVVCTWAKILRRVPGSRLLLHNRMGPVGGVVNPDIRHRLLGMFRQQGIRSSRICFAADLPLQEHLALYGEVDLALDPFPYNGMSTTFAALWMGVPVVTLWGPAAVSRVGGALMTTAGLPEFVANDEAGYVELAVRKAEDIAALARLRRGLRRQVGQSLLVDGKAFSGSLEGAFTEMLYAASWTKLKR